MSDERKFVYRVRPGKTHGIDKKGPGELVVLTRREAGGFMDKLEFVAAYDGGDLEAADPSTSVGAATAPEAAAPTDDPDIAATTTEFVSDHTVADILDLVEAGDLDAAMVLEAEQGGRGRVTLIDSLSAIIASGGDEEEE